MTADTADCYGRYLIRVGEMHESLKIIAQCLERLEPGPVMIEDKKLAWPADLQLGPDGLGNSPAHIARIMGTSMEGLIHHFKIVTEGFRVPVGQVYSAVESPRGELGVHMVSDGGTRPTGCTTGIPASRICKRWRRCAKAVWWPTSSPRWPASTR